MNPLYNFGIKAYAAAAGVAARFRDKPRQMLVGQADTLQALGKSISGPYDMWLHAASAGEYEQGAPIVEAALAHKPDARILVTFFSPSGYSVVSKKADKRLTLAYLPFDTPENARAMVQAVRPRMAVFVKYEFWGNYLSELQRAGVPAFLVSAVFRPGQIFFRPWGAEFRRMLQCFSHIYVQNDRSAALLSSIGIGRVSVAGDTRFDRVVSVRNANADMSIVDAFCNGQKVFVVGSSWPADEEIYAEALKSHAALRAIIAPHEFDDNRLDALRRRLGEDNVLLYTDLRDLAAADPEKAKQCAASVKYLILNTFGMLSSVYRYASVAYVGGGFGAGIHNINEAAVYGVPVIFGPNHSKFIEAGELIAAGGGFEVRSRQDFAGILNTLAADSSALAGASAAAEEYIKSKTGATGRICKDLMLLLHD